MDICEFKASLVYRVNFRTAVAIQRNPVSKDKTNKSSVAIISLTDYYFYSVLHARQAR